MENKLQIVKDLSNKKMTVTRLFDAPPELLWHAFTEKEYLDQWWAPEPWRAETKSMDFKEGGIWFYAMVSPEGQKHWSMVNFLKISPKKYYEGKDCFCDDKGNINKDLPSTHWKVEFLSNGSGAKVIVTMTFASEAALKQIVEMGFETGFTMTLNALEHYLSTGFKIRKELKTSNKARVTTYLNFPGNTEEAFHFYKKVFNGEFTGKGLTHFSDVVMPEGAPPLTEEHKKLILHAELTILGGHVLMATDAPESMGFELKRGNNMHINLEPETREETKRLFDALSEGGKIVMPLADMFFGAYFGELTDKYGINWMLNYQLQK